MKPQAMRKVMPRLKELANWTLGGRRPMCSERMVGKWLDMVVMEACREHGIWLKHDQLHLLLNRHLTELGE